LVSYCKKCNKETAIGQGCDCHIEIEKQEIETFNRNEERENIVKDDFVRGDVVKKQIENSCSNCRDFREFPEFLQLDCDHRLCEYCILMRRKEFIEISYIACPLCHN